MPRADQVEELGAVAVDAERVRQRQRHLAAGGVGDRRRPRGRRPWPRGAVEQIALEIDDRGCRRSSVGVDVVRRRDPRQTPR